MQNIIIIRSMIICLAEHSLRGLKAWTERVMAEWLKTLGLVLSRDQSCNRHWTLPGRMVVSTNKSTDSCILFLNEAEKSYK
jgi:hypothetical protein